MLERSSSSSRAGPWTATTDEVRKSQEKTPSPKRVADHPSDFCIQQNE